MKAPPPPISPGTWLRHGARHLWNRPRLSFAALVYVLALSLYPNHPARGLLLAFDIATATYLILIYRMMSRSTLASIRQRAEQQREGRMAVLATGLVVSMSTLVALSLELHAKGAALQELLSVSTIVLVWVFVNTLFTLHYAHDFYSRPGGLEFPGGEEPDYWDFVYFAFVLGMTFQVSDVQISARALRRTALLHSSLAFFFNVVIIALTVNIIAGLG